MKLNEKLKELREEEGITQATLADTLEVPRYIVGNWEQGRTAVDAIMLKKLAAFYKITVDEILDGVEEL